MFLAHALTENRHGILADFQVTEATGSAERDVVPAFLREAKERGFHPKTLGADKGYGTRGCMGAVRARRVSPHVAQQTGGAPSQSASARPAIAALRSARGCASGSRRPSAGCRRWVGSDGRAPGEWSAGACKATWWPGPTTWYASPRRRPDLQRRPCKPRPRDQQRANCALQSLTQRDRGDGSLAEPLLGAVRHSANEKSTSLSAFRQPHSTAEPPPRRARSGGAAALALPDRRFPPQRGEHHFSLIQGGESEVGGWLSCPDKVATEPYSPLGRITGFTMLRSAIACIASVVCSRGYVAERIRSKGNIFCFVARNCNA